MHSVYLSAYTGEGLQRISASMPQTTQHYGIMSFKGLIGPPLYACAQCLSECVHQWSENSSQRGCRDTAPRAVLPRNAGDEGAAAAVAAGLDVARAVVAQVLVTLGDVYYGIRVGSLDHLSHGVGVAILGAPAAKRFHFANTPLCLLPHYGAALGGPQVAVEGGVVASLVRVGETRFVVCNNVARVAFQPVSLGESYSNKKTHQDSFTP